MISSKQIYSVIFFITTLLVGLVILPSGLWADELGIKGFAAYEAGLAQYKDRQFGKAAQAWVYKGDQFFNASDGTVSLRRAALAYVMATIAFEKNKNARAYLTWGTAIRYFLEGRTTWDDERKQIKKMVKNTETQLKAVTVSEGLPGRIDDGRILLDIEQILSLSDYTGPDSGLSLRKHKEPAYQVHVRRNYFARPIPVTSQGPETFPKKTKGVMMDDPGKAGPGTQALSVPPMGRGIPVLHKKAPAPKPKPTQEAILEKEIFPQPQGPESTMQAWAPVSKDHKPDSHEESRALIAPRAIQLPRQQQAGALSALQREAARVAWQYFLMNYQNNTGLVNAVHNYPFATLWDMGSCLAGFIAARELDLISREEFMKKTVRFLETFLSMALYNNELPNREYNTRTGEMTDLGNRPSDIGSGWSALDIGRFLIWLRITALWYPDLGELVLKVVERWQFDRACLYKDLNGTLFNGKTEKLRQEGRLGYEQYGAMGYRLWGKDVSHAFDYKSLDTTEIFGVKLFYDTRNLAFLTSAPFVLSAMELGRIDPEFTRLTHSLYQVQKMRWQKTGILTAVSEDALDRSPWFSYNCIFFKGPWACVDHRGNPIPGKKNLSAKAAMAWSVIMDDAYAVQLQDAVVSLNHPRLGFYAGIFENKEINKALNINTNAVILEALLYKKLRGQSFLSLSVSQETE